MSTIEVLISGKRLDSDVKEVGRSECTIKIFARGTAHHNGEVSFYYDDNALINATAQEFYGICKALTGKPPRDWADIIRRHDTEFFDFASSKDIFESLSTVDQNLMKAAYLTFRLMNSWMFSHEKRDFRDDLYDQPFLDWHDGRVRNVPYIYFLPPHLHEERYHNSLRALYDLALLSYLQINSVGLHIFRYFKPLVVPGVSLNRFDSGIPSGGQNYDLWQKIKNAIEVSLQKRFSFSSGNESGQI